jgi:hypothetical protein
MMLPLNAIIAKKSQSPWGKPNTVGGLEGRSSSSGVWGSAPKHQKTEKLLGQKSKKLKYFINDFYPYSITLGGLL